MRAVFGLVELDAGEVLWEGRPNGLAERLRFEYVPRRTLPDTGSPATTDCLHSQPWRFVFS